jgi:hypothetical protein
MAPVSKKMSANDTKVSKKVEVVESDVEVSDVEMSDVEVSDEEMSDVESESGSESEYEAPITRSKSKTKESKADDKSTKSKTKESKADDKSTKSKTKESKADDKSTKSKTKESKADDKSSDSKSTKSSDSKSTKSSDSKSTRWKSEDDEYIVAICGVDGAVDEKTMKKLVKHFDSRSEKSIKARIPKARANHVQVEIPDFEVPFHPEYKGKDRTIEDVWALIAQRLFVFSKNKVSLEDVLKTHQSEMMTAIARGLSLKDPKKPKKPESAYLLFTKEYRENHVDEMKKAGKEGMKVLAAKWKELSDKQKEKYAPKETKSEEEYTRVHPYKLLTLKENQKTYKGPRKAKSESGGESEELKKPLNTYHIFCAERRLNAKKAKETVSQNELSAEWKAMSDGDKEKYTKLAEDAKNEYITEYTKRHGAPPSKSSSSSGSSKNKWSDEMKQQLVNLADGSKGNKQFNWDAVHEAFDGKFSSLSLKRMYTTCTKAGMIATKSKYSKAKVEEESVEESDVEESDVEESDEEESDEE